jgi:hypothetical protein
VKTGSPAPAGRQHGLIRLRRHSHISMKWNLRTGPYPASRLPRTVRRSRKGGIRARIELSRGVPVGDWSASGDVRPCRSSDRGWPTDHIAATIPVRFTSFAASVGSEVSWPASSRLGSSAGKTTASTSDCPPQPGTSRTPLTRHATSRRQLKHVSPEGPSMRRLGDQRRAARARRGREATRIIGLLSPLLQSKEGRMPKRPDFEAPLDRVSSVWVPSGGHPARRVRLPTSGGDHRARTLLATSDELRPPRPRSAENLSLHWLVLVALLLRASRNFTNSASLTY